MTNHPDGTTTHQVFVYGTLLPGLSNAHIWQESPGCRHVADGTVSGRIYRLGSFPGFKFGPDGAVKGAVIEVTDDVLRRLDWLEGVDSPQRRAPAMYRRIVVPVTIQSGPDALAYVYEWVRPAEPDDLIASGDWMDVEREMEALYGRR